MDSTFQRKSHLVKNFADIFDWGLWYRPQRSRWSRSPKLASPSKFKWWNCFGISIMNCWKNKPPIWIFKTSNSNFIILTTKAYSLLFFKKYSLVLETLWIAPNLLWCRINFSTIFSILAETPVTYIFIYYKASSSAFIAVRCFQWKNRYWD